MKKDSIIIGCACNDAYAQHLGVMIYSMLKNCKNPNKIIVYVADGGISTDNKKKIEFVLEDISKLYSKNFDNNIILAVKDPGGNNKKKLSLGLSEKEHYFNAGVML